MILLNIFFLLVCSYCMVVSTSPAVKFINGAAAFVNLAVVLSYLGS